MDEVKVFAAKAPLRVVQYEDDARVRARAAQRGIMELVLSPSEDPLGVSEAFGCSGLWAGLGSGGGGGGGLFGDGEDEDLLEGLVQKLHAQLPSVARAGNLDAEALRMSYDHVGAWFGLRCVRACGWLVGWLVGWSGWVGLLDRLSGWMRASHT
jgi:hypothetical protein